MSELHDDGERPQQYRAKCDNCGSPQSENLRMHSHLRRRHLQQTNVEWDSDETQIQCNVCGTIRTA